MEEEKGVIKLDYTIESPQERMELIKQIVETTPPERLTNKYLEILADYFIFAMEKQERKQKKILTPNRMVTVRKREASFEGLAEKFENGEDGLYNIINSEDKNTRLTSKISITQEDIDTIPGMKELREAIKCVEGQVKTAAGKRKYLLKKQAIEMRQDQYVLKEAYTKPIHSNPFCHSLYPAGPELVGDIYVEDGRIIDKSLVSFFNPRHISAMLCNYSDLKEGVWNKMGSELYFMLIDLEDLVDSTLKDKYLLYYDLLVYKIDKKKNAEIQDLLEEKYGIRHSVEYISSLWRNKIPRLLADQAEKNFLVWWYTYKERGKWKRCSRCRQIKLAHNKFFSKNKTSKDGWYSICKECRNKKKLQDS